MTTIDKLFKVYYERHCQVKTKSPANEQFFWHKYCAGRFGALTPEEVSSFDIQEWVDELGANVGKQAANRAYSVLCAIFSWSIKRGYVTASPCKNVEKFSVPSRKRFLSSEELTRFIAALDQVKHAGTRDFFWMLS